MSALDHDSDWHERLQEFVDGEGDANARAALEQHLAECARCRECLAELIRLDSRLLDLHAPPLPTSFDRRLFACIGEHDRTHAEARRRMERELEQGLARLSQGRRRGLTLIISGAIAALALAFALVSWLDASGWPGALLADALPVNLAAGWTLTITMTLTAAVGAAIGTILSRWLARTLE